MGRESFFGSPSINALFPVDLEAAEVDPISPEEPGVRTILDEEALLATCAYIDLNPVAASLAATPETSEHTSIRQRIAHAQSQGKLIALQEAAQGSVAGAKGAGGFEAAHWLCPLEDLRTKGIPREGFSLGRYLLLVDNAVRLGK